MRCENCGNKIENVDDTCLQCGHGKRVGPIPEPESIFGTVRPTRLPGEDLEEELEEMGEGAGTDLDDPDDD